MATFFSLIGIVFVYYIVVSGTYLTVGSIFSKSGSCRINNEDLEKWRAQHNK